MSEVAATEREVRLKVTSKQTMLFINARNFDIFQVLESKIRTIKISSTLG